MTKRGTIRSETERILPLIQKHLYPHREVFLRELVSNATDALNKWKSISNSTSALNDSMAELSITITVDRSSNTIAVSDNGIGMSEREIERYINEIAVSGAADFSKLNHDTDPLIGSFGVGFYSVFLVANSATIETKSFDSAEPGCIWRSKGDSGYELDSSSRTERGTRILLEIGSDHAEFLEADRLKQVVRRYCDYVPYPIYLSGELINSINPPWHIPSKALPARAYLDFYDRWYPGSNASRFWTTINIDVPLVMRGLLYVPDSPSDKGGIRLFCNRVFVDDRLHDALPPWLQFLRGAVDVEELPLNLSREKTREHGAIRQVCAIVVRKLAQEFARIAASRPEDFANLWTAYERNLKIAALEEDKWLELMFPLLLFETSHGELTNVRDYLSRNEQRHSGVAYYATDTRNQKAYLEQHRLQNKEVLLLTGELDLLVLERARTTLPGVADFRRVDSSPAEEPVRSESQDSTSFPFSGAKTALERAATIEQGSTETERYAFAEFYSTRCHSSHVTIGPTQPATFPVLMRREGTDAREADLQDLRRRIGRGKKIREDAPAVVLNSEHPLIKKLISIHATRGEGPFLSKACDLLHMQTELKFGHADEDALPQFLTQVEHFLTWLNEDTGSVKRQEERSR